MRKSIVSMALAIIVAMTVTACGNTASATSNTSTDASVEKAHEGTNTINVANDSNGDEVAAPQGSQDSQDSQDSQEPQETAEEVSETAETSETTTVEASVTTGKKGEEENPEPLDDPEYSNETFLTYVKCADPLFDADPAPFWVSEDEFDLDGWVRACGGFKMHETASEPENPGYTDPGIDEMEDILLSYGYWINSMRVQLSSLAHVSGTTAVFVSITDSNNAKAYASDATTDNWVYITGHDEPVDRNGLEATITIIRRIIHKDEKCLLRDLGFDHSERSDLYAEDGDFTSHDDQ